MIQLLSTEKLIYTGKIEDIILPLSETISILGDYDITETHTGGYIKKNDCAVAIYNGRKGVGLSIFEYTPYSTRYIKKYYYLFDIEYESFKKIIEKQLYIKIDEEAGEKRWQ